MGWQADMFAKLRDREWHQVGDLYEEVATRIPLHHAMRHAMRQSSRRGTEALPATTAARWGLFIETLGHIGVETDGPRGRKWTHHVRLRYVRDRVCDHCGGPVSKAVWASKSLVTCLACTGGTKPAPAPEPLLLPPPRPAAVVALPTPRPVVVKIPEAESARDFYQRQKAFALFLKVIRLPFLSVTGILKKLS